MVARRPEVKEAVIKHTTEMMKLMQQSKQMYEGDYDANTGDVQWLECAPIPPSDAAADTREVIILNQDEMVENVHDDFGGAWVRPRHGVQREKGKGERTCRASLHNRTPNHPAVSPANTIATMLCAGLHVSAYIAHTVGEIVDCEVTMPSQDGNWDLHKLVRSRLVKATHAQQAFITIIIILLLLLLLLVVVVVYY